MTEGSGNIKPDMQSNKPVLGANQHFALFCDIVLGVLKQNITTVLIASTKRCL